MPTTTARMQREERTIQAMIRLYCRLKHNQREDLCPECQDLQNYAHARLEKCPFAPHKPTCARCPVHCYRPERREQIRAVMRFAGPRMLVRHPILTIRHLMDGRKKPPAVKRK